LIGDRFLDNLCLEGSGMKMIPEEFFEKIRPRDKLIGWSIIFVPILGLAAFGMIFLRPIPISAELVMGCYTAKGSPSLDVRRGSIRIDEPQHRAFSYVAEPAKVGYHLTVSPAISLRSAGSERYVFAQDERGEGYFWPLLTTRSDDPRYMRKPTEYGGRFQLIADNGKSIIYTRTAREVCS
jgi:hypothetical protein